jgi:hypothetical protein
MLVWLSPLGTLGGWVSGQGLVEATIEAFCELFPAQSYASTASVWVVPQASAPKV